MSFQESSESLRSKLHLVERPGLPVIAGLCALAIVAVAIAATALLGIASPEPLSVELDEAETPAAQSGEAGAGASDDGSGGESQRIVVVHVGGAVVSPGVYELAEGSRVSDAVEAAGGAAEGAAFDALNLARILNDGEQIIVPTLEQQQEQLQAATTGGTASSVAGGKVNINTASAEQLDTLPGVGESTAQKIIADRDANGPFSSPEDLKRVSGIGDKKYEEIADLITVG